MEVEGTAAAALGGGDGAATTVVRDVNVIGDLGVSRRLEGTCPHVAECGPPTGTGRTI
jgi:hypothetical protein